MTFFANLFNVHDLLAMWEREREGSEQIERDLSRKIERDLSRKIERER